MPSNAFMMIHKPSTMAFGNADDFRKVADDLDVIEKGLLGVYEDNIVDGVDFEEVKEMVNNETWLDAEEAIKYFDIEDRKSTRLNSSHVAISYAVFCLKKKYIVMIH